MAPSGKTINFRSELPDEFDLTDYEDLYDKPALWWGQQLSERAAKLSWNKLPQHELLSKDERLKIRLLTYPDLKISRADQIGQIEWGIISTPIATRITHGYAKSLIARGANMHDLEYINSEGELFPREYLSISLDASDEAIISEVRELISKARERRLSTHCKPLISKTKLKKLHDYRVLPLIDILTWEILTGNKIKRSTLAMILFPEGQKGERELTDTIIPFAQKALTVRFMNDLVRTG